MFSYKSCFNIVPMEICFINNQTRQLKVFLSRCFGCLCMTVIDCIHLYLLFFNVLHYNILCQFIYKWPRLDCICSSTWCSTIRTLDTYNLSCVCLWLNKPNNWFIFKQDRPQLSTPTSFSIRYCLTTFYNHFSFVLGSSYSAVHIHRYSLNEIASACFQIQFWM